MLKVYDLKLVLDSEKYGITQRVAVFESKENILKSHGINETIISLYKIDTRILSLMGKTRNSDKYDYFIVVYDFENFMSDIDFAEAIIYHELGHINNPADIDNFNVEIEAKCDKLAIEAGYKEGLERVLQSTLHLMQCANNQQLIDKTIERIEILNAE